MLLDETNHAAASGRRKNNRLEARVTAEEKALIKQAADIQGCSLTEFVVRSAQEAARKAIKENRGLTLSARDTKAFIDALLKPPAPSKKLKLAADRYKEIMGQ